MLIVVSVTTHVRHSLGPPSPSRPLVGINIHPTTRIPTPTPRIPAKRRTTSAKSSRAIIRSPCTPVPSALKWPAPTGTRLWNTGVAFCTAAVSPIPTPWTCENVRFLGANIAPISIRPSVYRPFRSTLTAFTGGQEWRPSPTTSPTGYGNDVVRGPQDKRTPSPTPSRSAVRAAESPLANQNLESFTLVEVHIPGQVGPLTPGRGRAVRPSCTRCDHCVLPGHWHGPVLDARQYADLTLQRRSFVPIGRARFLASLCTQVVEVMVWFFSCRVKGYWKFWHHRNKTYGLSVVMPALMRTRLTASVWQETGVSVRILNCVLMRVIDAVKETVAAISSVSPSSFALTKT